MFPGQQILPSETVCFFTKDLMTLSIRNIHRGKQFCFKIGRYNYKCRISLCLHTTAISSIILSFDLAEQASQRENTDDRG